MGNILKLLPSLKEKIPTLDSLLPILSEHVPQYAKNALPTTAVPQQPQTPMDELVLPPILVPKLYMTKIATCSSISFYAYGTSTFNLYFN